jgi:hypothetical protein
MGRRFYFAGVTGAVLAGAGQQLQLQLRRTAARR